MADSSLIGAMMRRARNLLRFKILDTYDHSLLTVMVFGCRSFGAPTVRLSYSQLMQRSNQSRARIAKGLRNLARLGFLAIEHERILAVNLYGGRLWRQLTNTYRLITREFTGRTDSEPKAESSTVSTSIVIVEAASKEQEEAQEALRRVRERPQLEPPRNKGGFKVSYGRG